VRNVDVRLLFKQFRGGGLVEHEGLKTLRLELLSSARKAGARARAGLEEN
jgi:hypothetical protein